MIKRRKIKNNPNPAGKTLEDIADLLSEGNVLLNAQSFSGEFQVHKHIGDYTLFMLGMFPEAISRRRGKEFILGSIIIPGANLSECYLLQGKRFIEKPETLLKTPNTIKIKLSTGQLIF